MSEAASIPSGNSNQPKNAPIPGENFKGIKGSAAISAFEIAQTLGLTIIPTKNGSWTMSEADWYKVRDYPIYVYGADGKPAEKNGNPIQDNVFRIRLPKGAPAASDAPAEGEVFDFEKPYTVGGISLSIADNKGGNVIVAPALQRMPTFAFPKPFVAPPFNAQPPLPELASYQLEPVSDAPLKPYILREDAPEDQTLYRIVLPEKTFASLAHDLKELVTADLHNRTAKIRDKGAALWNDFHKAAVSLIPHTKKNEPPVDISEPADDVTKSDISAVTAPKPESTGTPAEKLPVAEAAGDAAEPDTAVPSSHRANPLRELRVWARSVLSRTKSAAEKTGVTEPEAVPRSQSMPKTGTSEKSETKPDISHSPGKTNGQLAAVLTKERESGINYSSNPDCVERARSSGAPPRHVPESAPEAETARGNLVQRATTQWLRHRWFHQDR